MVTQSKELSLASSLLRIDFRLFSSIKLVFPVLYLIFTLLTSSANAQNPPTCNCAVTITQAGIYNNATLHIQPGQIVCVQAGHYDYLRFVGFTGTATHPIRFVNCGGQVGIGVNNYLSGISIQHSSYFILSGSGDSNHHYGFLFDRTYSISAPGISVSGLSTNYEIERVEVAMASYAGFVLKVDPTCDPTTWQANYTIHDVRIHDNYVHDTGGAGMLFSSGYSATAGANLTCNGAQTTVYPVQMYGLQVYNNRIEQTTGVGLQVNNAPDASLYNNTLVNTNLGPIPPGWQVGGPAGCDYTVMQAGTYNNPRLGVRAGQTVCIQAGHYDYLRFTGFVGTAAQPIRFLNRGGLVTAGVDAYTTGIQFMTSRYFALTGTGDPAYAYGIKLTQSNSGGGMGVSVGGLSSDCELDHIEVAKAGFAGIMVKTDPNCDSMTWQSNFIMYNVKIHDNYIHDVGGEGLYIGNSFHGTGVTITCNGAQKQVYPHLIYGLEIYNNRIERSGAEGLQYGCAPDAKVHHNWMQNTGISPFAAYQNNGLQIGGGAGGDCYSNTVLNVSGTGIIIIGHLGNNRIFNNVVNNVGQDGIFCDDRIGSVPGTTMQFIHNTISNSGRDGIRLYNEINTNTVANNAITGYGTRVSGSRPILLGMGVIITSVGNFTALSTSNAGYSDVANNDFSLLPTSPLIDAGVSAVQWGVTMDVSDLARPMESGYDIGAYEYTPVALDMARGRMGINSDSLSEAVLEYNPSSAYPTPCFDQVTIQLPVGYTINRVSVYSTQGRLIKYLILPGVQSVVVLPTQNWSTGVYTYQVRSKNRLFRGRLIKL